jgi:hypothetical protein
LPRRTIDPDADDVIFDAKTTPAGGCTPGLEKINGTSFATFYEVVKVAQAWIMATSGFQPFSPLERTNPVAGSQRLSSRKQWG